MYSTKYPVIKSQHVHPDVVNAIRFLMNKNGQSQLLMKAYVAKNYRVCSGLNCEKAHK